MTLTARTREHRWEKTNFSITDGLDGGPMSLFDKGSNALFISPFTSFMAASVYHDTINGYYNWGVMGGVKEVPRGFSTDTMIFYSNEGVNQVS